MEKEDVGGCDGTGHDGTDNITEEGDVRSHGGTTPLIPQINFYNIMEEGGGRHHDGTGRSGTDNIMEEDDDGGHVGTGCGGTDNMME